MRIVRVEVERLPLTLKEPYTIAYETVSEAENLLLRIVTEGPDVGLGISAPAEAVTGESIESSLAALCDVAVPLLVGQDVFRRSLHVERLADALPDAPSARAAVDQALHDLLAKRAGLPAWRLLGGYRPTIATSVTIFITPTDEAVARAREFVAQGFRALKIKGGRDVDEDIERVLAIRAAVGPAIQLRFDANQGYTVDQARSFFLGTRSTGLALIEQPTPAEQLASMRAVVRQVATPVVADESVLSLADAFHFARHDAMDMVNLKLQKAGGLDAAALMNGLARSAGMDVMVGCMDEAALSIAASLAFALSRRNVEYADLDGHLDFTDDPTAGCVHLEDGMLRPDESPGFGLADV